MAFTILTICCRCEILSLLNRTTTDTDVVFIPTDAPNSFKGNLQRHRFLSGHVKNSSDLKLEPCSEDEEIVAYN